MYFCFPSLDKNAVVVLPTVRFWNKNQTVRGSLLRNNTSSKPSLIEECFALRQSKTVLDPRIPLCGFRIIFLVSGAWIPGSGCMLVGSGFLELNYRFQSPEFRISPAKLSRIPESGLPCAVVVRKWSPKRHVQIFARTFRVYIWRCVLCVVGFAKSVYYLIA